MLSFFQKNKSKKHQHQQTHQSTNALPTCTADIKTSTFSEVKQSLTAALSGRLKHKGSVKSINLDYVDCQVNHPAAALTPEPPTKFSLLRKKASEPPLATGKPTGDEPSKEPPPPQPPAVKEAATAEPTRPSHGLPKAKSGRFIQRSHIPFINSGYFTVGRGKKPAPSLGD